MFGCDRPLPPPRPHGYCWRIGGETPNRGKSNEQTPNLITNVETTLATTPDGSVTSVVHRKLAEKDLLPSEHYLDGAYVDSSELVESNQVYQVSVVGRVAVDSSWQAKLETGFDVAAFVIDWDKHLR